MAGKRNRGRPPDDQNLPKRQKRDDSEKKNSRVKQDSPLFHQNFGDALVRICNELDWSTFLRFSATCSQMKNFGFSQRELHVDFSKRTIFATTNFVPGYKENNLSFHLKHLRGEEFELTRRTKGKPDMNYSPEELEKLQKMPISINLSSVWLESTNQESLDLFMEFINKYRNMRFSKLWTRAVTDWTAFLNFVEAKSVKTLEISEGTVEDGDTLTRLLQSVESLTFWNIAIEDNQLLRAKVKYLRVDKTFISANTFIHLFKRFEKAEIDHWSLMTTEKYKDLLTACLTIHKEKKKESMANINAARIEKGIWYTNPGYAHCLFLLREDGRIGRVRLPSLKRPSNSSPIFMEAWNGEHWNEWR